LTNTRDPESYWNIFGQKSLFLVQNEPKIAFDVRIEKIEIGHSTTVREGFSKVALPRDVFHFRHYTNVTGYFVVKKPDEPKKWSTKIYSSKKSIECMKKLSNKTSQNVF